MSDIACKFGGCTCCNDYNDEEDLVAVGHVAVLRVKSMISTETNMMSGFTCSHPSKAVACAAWGSASPLFAIVVKASVEVLTLSDATACLACCWQCVLCPLRWHLGLERACKVIPGNADTVPYKLLRCCSSVPTQQTLRHS